MEVKSVENDFQGPAPDPPDPPARRRKRRRCRNPEALAARAIEDAARKGRRWAVKAIADGTLRNLAPPQKPHPDFDAAGVLRDFQRDLDPATEYSPSDANIQHARCECGKFVQFVVGGTYSHPHVTVLDKKYWDDLAELNRAKLGWPKHGTPNHAKPAGAGQ